MRQHEVAGRARILHSAENRMSSSDNVKPTVDHGKEQKHTRSSDLKDGCMLNFRIIPKMFEAIMISLRLEKTYDSVIMVINDHTCTHN